MTLTFAETHNMVTYLTKSDASEGFNQIIDFLNESSIKYALTVNPNIYVSCIKQFWTTVAVKKVNDIMSMSAKRTSWNEFSSSMASAVICLSSGDLSTHTIKYTSSALTQKVFANMRRVGKGFFGVDTLVFEGMLVAQEVEEGVADENVKNVNAGDAANDEVPTADEEASITSPTLPTPPPQPSQDIHSTSQAQPKPPQSPQVYPQSPQPQPPPTQDAGIPINLLQEVMNICIALTRRVEDLELDKVAQDIEITKLKQRVKKLERRNKVKVLKLRRLQKVGTGQRIKTADDTVMDDVYNQGRMISDMDVDADVVLEEAKEVAADAKANQDAKVVDVVTTAKLITEVVTAASTTITAAKVLVSAATTTTATSTLTAALRRRTKGVVIRDPKESTTTTTSTIIHTEAKSKDNGKGILKTKEHIEEEESKALKSINETLADKAAKRRKLDEEIEELKRHLLIVPNKDDDVYTKATPFAHKVPVVDYKIINLNNKPYYKIIRADDTHQLYTCSNLEESKKCTWSSKSQGLEAVGIL
nr:hypothetical protein [Tanacetum cinerariifolium]